MSVNDLSFQKSFGVVSLSPRKGGAPRRYHLVFHDDDTTHPKALMRVSSKFFGMALPDALNVVEQVHLKGKAILTTNALPWEQADAKKVEIEEHVRVHYGYPVKIELQKASL